jgi:hypothetical protein
VTDRDPANPTSATAPPVLIIGAHRSGTTATARALELLGLQIGQRLDSHCEAKSLQRMHEAYLQQLGAAWHQPEAFLARMATADGRRECAEYLRNRTRHQFGRIFGYRNNPRGWWLRARLRFGAAWGWKEPRTTLFAPSWLEVFPQARFVEVVRHPLAVALSIRARDLRFRAAGDRPTANLDQVEYCLRLALLYVAAGERLAASTSRYRRVRFEALQEDAPGTLRDLAAFSNLRPAPAQIALAAQSIRPPALPVWPSLTSEEKAALLTHSAAVTRLGYDLSGILTEPC